jgi:hypothetical protein
VARGWANQRMKLTGAAILVMRGMKVLQATPAAYPYSFGWKTARYGMMQMLIPVSELGPSPRIIMVDRYGDGTIWWLMEDERQARAVVCLDGCVGSPTQYRLLDGTRHPKHPGGKTLELGCPEEGLAVPLLSRWLDSQIPKDVASEYSIEVVREALLRLGDVPQPAICGAIAQKPPNDSLQQTGAASAPVVVSWLSSGPGR